MKNLLSITLTILILSAAPVFADGDIWDNFGDQNIYGSKEAVSDKDFDKALESKKKTKKPKQMKGDSYQESNETEVINQIPKELPIVSISIPIQINEDSILPPGHYQVVGEQRQGKIFLKLYQAHYLITELEAQETFDDYNEPEVHFVKFIMDQKDNQLKIVYGSIDFNAYAIVQAAEER